MAELSHRVEHIEGKFLDVLWTGNLPEEGVLPRVRQFMYE